MARPHSPVHPPSPSPSPAPPLAQPLTKRDVRRNRIMERLNQMVDAFSSNQHAHYRAQLQAVQVDMTLVLRADPYEGGPLEDGAEEIRAMVEEVTRGTNGGGPGGFGGDEAAQRDFVAMAGKRYGQFVGEVNDCLERRDVGLTALHDHYQSSIDSLTHLTEHKLHQADEEHKALSSTVRQRLVASITKKRQQLLRDKEQLDIADSNALLLHPSHFSINNPGSPGGPTQNRKTRHLRHRATSPGAAEAGDHNGNGNGKKKRKVNALDDGDLGGPNDSPAPPHGFRFPPPDALGGGRSPFKDAREKNGYTQFEAPAYSLERLFTEKELTMATATAQQATYRYFHTPQTQREQDGQQGSGSGGTGTAAPSVDGQEVPADATGEGQQGEDGVGAARPTTENVGTPPPGHPTPMMAAEMERSTSHQVLTRGVARANPLAGLSDLATAAASASAGFPASRENPFAPVVPSYHAVSRSEKSGAPTPGGIGQFEADSDFEMMRRSANHQHDDADPEDLPDADATGPAAEGATMRRQLLDQALGNPSVTQPYRLPVLETGPAVIGKGVDRPSWTGFSDVKVYEQQRMRQQISNFAGAGVAGAIGGAGAGGSLAAALQGRMGGGEPMSRTTSVGAGSEGGEAVVPVRRFGKGRLV